MKMVRPTILTFFEYLSSLMIQWVSVNLKRHKQAALDFCEEAGLRFDLYDSIHIYEKHKIRKLLLSEQIEDVIQEVEKIDTEVSKWDNMGFPTSAMRILENWEKLGKPLLDFWEQCGAAPGPQIEKVYNIHQTKEVQRGTWLLERILCPISRRREVHREAWRILSFLCL